MACTNGIPYGIGTSTDPAGDLWTGKNYTPRALSKAKDKDDKTEKDRAKIIVDFFSGKKFNETGSTLPKEFGYAVAGVWSAESNISPWSFNPDEQENGYAFRNVHAPNAKTFEYGGTTYYMDQANMMKFGYGKGLAQWSWSRVLKFRDWYNSSEGTKTPGVDMDDCASAITATSVTTQTAFAWKEMQERTGEFKKQIESIETADPNTDKEKFDRNIILAVDAILRGYENGGKATMRTPHGDGKKDKKGMDSYTWDGGYEGALRKRVEKALGVYEALKS